MSTMEQRFEEFESKEKSSLKTVAPGASSPVLILGKSDVIAFSRSEVARRDAELMAPSNQWSLAEATIRDMALSQPSGESAREIVEIIDHLRASEKLLRERVRRLEARESCGNCHHARVFHGGGPSNCEACGCVEFVSAMEDPNG